MDVVRYTSDKENVVLLIEVLIQKGVRKVVLSPGSRNAPLLISFAREKRIQYFVVVDERSAAFMALGMAQQSGEPVAIVCTSGSAPLNYAPAIAEAYYQRLPLVVITADRPVEWIDQEDNQTIRQNGMFAHLVKASYQLPTELRNDEERWYANRMLNDALNCALRGRKGPIHINLPLREPLYGERVYLQESIRSIAAIEPASKLSAEWMNKLVHQFNGCRKIMILAGFYQPDLRLQMALQRLSQLDQVIVFTETLSNVHAERFIETIDRVLATLSEEEESDYAPDLLISFGGSLVSKQIKNYLRRYRPIEHWYIDQSEHPADTFQALTLQVALSVVDFFESLSEQVISRDSDYALKWQQKRKLATERHHEFEYSVGWCDWKAYALIWPTIPEGTLLQLSNSTPVRYAQLFERPAVFRMDANRGTSGIEGATSTALGAANVYPGITLLVTGDMSFLYDSNALWNRYVHPRFKVIVMKNGGGGIFRFISGPSELEELEECFETTQNVDVKGYAELHHFRYFEAISVEKLQIALPEFWAENERSAILAVETPACLNAEKWKTYFRCLKGE